MRYLVTGGAGFVGSHTVERLLAEGHDVRVLDNFSSGSRRNLPDAADGRLEVVEGDIRDDRVLEHAVRDVDGVFHLAALVSVQQSIEQPMLCFDVNARGSANVLNAARRAGVRRVVLASSAAVYGNNPDLPLRESATPNPLSPYALDKLYAERAGELYTALYGLDAVALRYFNVYGPRQPADSPYSGVISRFVEAGRRTGTVTITIYGDGRQTRDFIHVHDVVRANLLAMRTPRAGFRVLNVASGRSVTVLALYDLVVGIAGRNVAANMVAPRPGDIRDSSADVQAAQEYLGFTAQVGLEEGVRGMLHSEGAIPGAA